MLSPVSFDMQRLCRLLPKIWEMESRKYSGEQGPENVEFIFALNQINYLSLLGYDTAFCWFLF